MIASVALLLAVGWQVGASAVRIFQLGVRDAQVEGMFDDLEGRLRRAFGDDYASYELIRDHTPERSMVYCNLLRGHDELEGGLDDAFLLQRLRHALHPRFVLGLDFRDPGHRATLPGVAEAYRFPAAGVTYEAFVCDFRSELDGDPPPPLQKLVERAGFELWGVPR